MALSAATVLEVRADASDDNGGGFTAGGTGTDRSQQAAAHATLTAASVVHTTTTQINVSAGDYTVTALDADNLLQITGGTATAGFYRITAVDVGNNRWTLDRSAGTAGQTVVGRMGGALVSPGKAAGAMTVAGMITWVRNGTYSITSTTSNITGGRIALGVANTRMIGYDAERGDETGVQPTFTAAVNTMTLVTITNDVFFGNIRLSAGSATGITGTNSSGGCVLYKVRMTGANTSAAFRGLSNSHHMLCEATGGTVTGFNGEGGHFFGSVARAVAGRGFQAASGETIFCHCVSLSNTGGTGKGFDLGTATGSAMYINCTAFGNAEDNFDNSAAPPAACQWINCLSYSSGDNGFNGGGRAWNCASGGNATDDYGAAVIQINCETLTEDPFTDSANFDLSLNDVAGGGAECKGSGLLGAFPSLITTTGHLDMGAVQSQDGGNGGSSVSRSILLALPRTWLIEN